MNSPFKADDLIAQYDRPPRDETEVGSGFAVVSGYKDSIAFSKRRQVPMEDDGSVILK